MLEVSLNRAGVYYNDEVYYLLGWILQWALSGMTHSSGLQLVCLWQAAQLCSCTFWHGQSMAEVWGGREKVIFLERLPGALAA